MNNQFINNQYRNNNIITSQNENPNIIVERHIIPLNIYRELYGFNINNNNTSNSNQDNQHQARRNTIYDYFSNYLNNNNSYTSPRTSQTENNNTETETLDTTQQRSNATIDSFSLILQDENGNEVNYNLNYDNTNNNLNPNNRFTNNIFSLLFGGNSNLYSSPFNNQITGLRQEEIDNNTTVYNFNSDENSNNDENSTRSTQCSICHDNYNNTCELRMINNCGHDFHKSCIDIWFSSNRTCPICRGNVV